jgi:hypothetical protein
MYEMQTSQLSMLKVLSTYLPAFSSSGGYWISMFRAWKDYKWFKIIFWYWQDVSFSIELAVPLGGNVVPLLHNSELRYQQTPLLSVFGSQKDTWMHMEY